MKPRIFIVEDEPFYAATLRQQLCEIGYEVPAISESGEDAAVVASSEKFDLALVDLRLAGEMDGITLAGILSQRHSLPSVLMSGAPDPKLIERAIASRPYGYIAKPIDNRILKVTIETALQRRLTEIKLAQRENELEDVLRTSMDAFVVFNLEGRVIEANQTACVITGFDRAELLTKTLADLEHDRTQEQINAGINAIMSAGALQIERQIRRKNGAIRIVELSVACSLAPAGRLYCFGRDVTERRRAEMRLQLLKRAVEQSPASIVITDTTGAIEYVNPYFEKHTGYSAAEALGQNPRILKSEEHLPEHYKNLWDTITGGNEWRGELRNRRKDGTFYWEQASISPVRDDNGKIVHYVAVKEDITERKASELTLAWQAALFENSIDVCCVKDLDLRIVAANLAMAHAAGVSSPDALIGKTDLEIYKTSRGREAALNYMEDDRSVQRFKPGQILERQDKLYLPDGSERTTLTRKFPVFNRHGVLIGTANISTDITAAKQAEADLIRAKEEAEAANKTKSAFLATMSHELRTPLNVINGMAAILGQGNWPPEHRHAIELITEGGNTLLNIIEEILDYSGLQAGKTKLDLTPFSPGHVLCTALRLFSPSALSKGLNLTCSVDPRIPSEAIGDGRRLQQVLVNLIHNAIKFTERGRVHACVRLAASAPGECVLVFSVHDTGIGVSPEAQQKLFQAFSQGDDTITRKFGGTGLGLAISQSFIQMMGGNILVGSKPGRGSKFHFKITLKTAGRVPSLAQNLARPQFANRRVLVVQRKGAPQRMLLALLKAWNLRLIVTEPSAISTISSTCDAAILPADAYPVSDKAVFAPACPTIWYGTRDTLPSGEPTLPSVKIGSCLDPHELAANLTSLFAPQASVRPPGPGHNGTKVASQPVIPLNILAADDNRTNREVLVLVLAHLGYKADVVTDGAEAVAAVQRKPYDLLLLDVQMPVMDGLTAASEICRIFPDPNNRVRIVALTANALPGDRERCLAAGMDSYLSKPVVPADLRNCIHGLFQGKQNGAASKAMAASEEFPLIDFAHLQTITAGMTPEQLQETLNHLHLSVRNDYEENYPLVVDACSQRDQKRFAEVVHGLKGCFLMTGWTKAGKRCATAIAAARQGSFNDWSAFPEDLGQLFAKSSEAMTAHLNKLSQEMPPQTVASSNLSSP